MIRGSLRETFDLDQNGLKKLKETIRVKYTKATKEMALKVVNEVCDEGLNGNYPKTQKRVLVFPNHITGTIYNDNPRLLFVEYGAGMSGSRRPHPEPQAVEYNFRVYDHYNEDYVGQQSQHIFYDKVEDMRKKLKELGG